MVIGAILKGAAKGLAKGASKARSAMGRVANRASDAAYNARRRFTRSAERKLKQAENETGVYAARLRQLAQEDLKKAANLYQKKADRERFAKEHGIPVPKESSAETVERLKGESFRTLESAYDTDEVRREEAAHEIMRGPAGSRILAATRSIWAEEDASDISGIYERLKQFFGTDSLMDVVERFENEIGEDLYAEPESSEKYDEVVSQGMLLVERMLRVSDGEA